MYAVSLVSLTALLLSCNFGVVASQDQQCSTFIDSSCPESWHYWGVSCYKITETKFTWSDAKDECRNMGGVLAVPSSDPENEFIVSLIPKAEGLWLDCNDKETEGTWKCREGNVDVTYRNWYPGEPNNFKIEEDCVEHDTWAQHHGWYDVDCNREFLAVCKFVIRPVLHL